MIQTDTTEIRNQKERCKQCYYYKLNRQLRYIDWCHMFKEFFPNCKKFQFDGIKDKR